MTYSNTYSSPSSPTNFNPFSGMGMRKGGRPSLFPGSGDGSTLNLDFTTGVLDSRLTFSRASTATFVNSSGYVESAASNEMTYSQSQDSNTFWSAFGTNVVRTSAQTDPNGGTAAVKLVFTATAADAVISRTVAINNGLPYTISMWMRSDSGTLTNVRFARGAAATGAFFPTLTTTWQRVSLSFTSTGANDGIEIRVLNSGSPQTATFHVYGAQLESGSTVRAYQPAVAA
ncbi:Carbohydrate-binding, CenC-like, partial [uncultured Caudovirales phage]